MAYAFLSHVYGEDDQGLIQVMNAIEYAPHTDAHWDPFSVFHKASLPLCSANYFESFQQ